MGPAACVCTAAKVRHRDAKAKALRLVSFRRYRLWSRPSPLPFHMRTLRQGEVRSLTFRANDDDECLCICSCTLEERQGRQKVYKRKKAQREFLLK